MVVGDGHALPRIKIDWVEALRSQVAAFVLQYALSLGSGKCIYPRTSIPVLWEEINDKTETYEIPLLLVIIFVHFKEVLFLNRRMARVQVDWRHVHP